jgi:Transposase
MACRYVGIGWASEEHEVIVADEVGVEVLGATFAHDEGGLAGLCRTLVRLDVDLVAIERLDGLLVERLLDAGMRVLALHPNKVAAARDRFRVSGGKSDRFDAFVLCELACTDHHRFRVLEPDSDHEGDPGADPGAGGSRPGTHRDRQPVARRAGAVIARAVAAVQPHGRRDSARVPGALPQSSGRSRPRSRSDARISCARALLGWPAPDRPDGQAPQRPTSRPRRTGARRAPRRSDHAAERPPR